MKTNENIEKTLKELTLQMARAIVSQPDRVNVDVVGGTTMIVLELSVDPIDTGRVVGKGGQVATAMRTLLRTSAAKDSHRVLLEIVS
jgi:hypothetical protein